MKTAIDSFEISNGFIFIAFTQTYLMQRVVTDKDIGVVDPVSII